MQIIVSVIISAVMVLGSLVWTNEHKPEPLGANTLISALSTGTSLDDADHIIYNENSGTQTTKKITWANATSSLQTWFNGIYSPIFSTSAGLATLLNDETGSGGGFVRATSPTITTPTITSPTINTSFAGTAVLGISQGGTGSTTKSDALNALLPDQSGNNGKSLVTNGTTASFTGEAIPSASGKASSSPLLVNGSGTILWGEALPYTLLCDVSATGTPAQRYTCTVPSKNFYKILIGIASTTNAGATTRLQINGDTGNNYTVKTVENGTQITSTESGNGLEIFGGPAITPIHSEISCWNQTTSLKTCSGNTTGWLEVIDSGIVWQNSTSTAVTSFGIVVSAGNYGYGTRLRVFGSPD